jgi:hypothetical protein
MERKQMKATLEFELPQDAFEHQTAIDGWKWRMIVNDISENLRTDLKYNNNLHHEAAKNLESLRSFIFQRMTEENISLD